MGDLFRVKSQMLVYQDVMGRDMRNDTPAEHKIRLERNAKRFANLPKSLKEDIAEKYAILQEQLNFSFGQKIKRLLQIFAYGVSPYELAWIFFSIVIPILLLKRIEGARHAAWLLPVMALLFLFENQKANVLLDPEQTIFPSEHKIIHTYLKEPLGADILKQREQLLHGWLLYLITEWAHEAPSDDAATFQVQAEKGEFLFNIERLEFVPEKWIQPKTSLLLLCVYLAWNFFFAWYVNRHLKRER